MAGHLNRREVGQLRDGCAEVRAIARAKFRRGVRVHRGRAVVRKQVDRPGRRRADRHGGDDALGVRDVEPGFVALLTGDGDVGLGRRALRLHLAGELLHLLLGVGEDDRELLTVARREDLLLGEVNPRALGRAARLFEIGPRSLLASPELRLGFLNLGLGLLQLGLLLFERPLLHRGVELNDDVARFHRSAVGRQLHDLQVRPGRGGRQRD